MKTETPTTEILYTLEQLEPQKMYIKISSTAYLYGGNQTRDFWKGATGYYLEVETKHLFNNQYNTQQFRVYDTQVSEVINDQRAQWCKNKYTGAMVKVGEEKEYLNSQIDKAFNNCGNCFWNQKQIVETKTDETEEQKTTVTKYERKCTYKEEAGCTHMEAVSYGFDYFTPDNTYFLKQQQEEANKIGTDCIKIGTYYLEYYDSLGYYRIRNNRKTINFKYSKGFFYVSNGIGYKTSKTIDIPSIQLRKLLEILNG